MPSKFVGQQEALAFTELSYPTFYALADNVQCAQNKSHISIMNNSGSGVSVAVRKLFPISNQLTAATGVGCRFELHKITAHTSGSDITPLACDSSNSLPALITVKSAATITGTTLVFPINMPNDEIGATGAFPTATIAAGTNWIPEADGMEYFTLRSGEGISVKQITSSTVGYFSWLIVFTVSG